MLMSEKQFSGGETDISITCPLLFVFLWHMENYYLTHFQRTKIKSYLKNKEESAVSKGSREESKKTDRAWQGVKIMADLCTGGKRRKKDNADLERITSSCGKSESPVKGDSFNPLYYFHSTQLIIK